MNETKPLGESVHFSIYRPGGLNLYDGMILCKSFNEDFLYLTALYKKRKIPVVLDLCDNYTMLYKGMYPDKVKTEELQYMIDMVDWMVFSTPELAQQYRSVSRRDIPYTVIPDPIDDFGDIRPLRVPQSRFRLLWYGNWGVDYANVGIVNLRTLLPAISSVKSEIDIELRIMSNNFDEYTRVCSDMPIPTSYVEWSMEQFPIELANADLVILPVSPGPFTLGKSNNRMTAALAHGVPVLADRIPRYEEFPQFLVTESWSHDLRRAIHEIDVLRRNAEMSKKHVRANYGIASIGAQWARLVDAQILDSA
jgi:glycosyltransferase involved in cell wall biosynthesis